MLEKIEVKKIDKFKNISFSYFVLLWIVIQKIIEPKSTQDSQTEKKYNTNVVSLHTNMVVFFSLTKK